MFLGIEVKNSKIGKLLGRSKFYGLRVNTPTTVFGVCVGFTVLGVFRYGCPSRWCVGLLNDIFVGHIRVGVAFGGANGIRAWGFGGEWGDCDYITYSDGKLFKYEVMHGGYIPAKLEEYDTPRARRWLVKHTLAH